MPSNSIRKTYLAIALSLTSKVIGTPQIAFPINSQLPPVAYALQPFEFSFSTSTFTSDASEISYALSRQPGWLSLESSSRRLLGTPGSGDAGAPTFDIIASDNSGQVSSRVTLVVQQERTLSLNGGGLLSQLSSAGGVSAPGALLLHPQQPFEFSLGSSLFNGSSANTAFYAVSSDGSPLPSWIQFDSTRIRFTGTTPPSRAPEPSGQMFPFKLVASNVIGFSEASLQLDILVNSHLLAFTSAMLNRTVSKGSPFQTQSLLQYVTIDGVVATRDQLVFVNSNTPSWLRFDDSNLSFAGNVPNDFEGSTISISVGASGTNVANLTLDLQISEQQNTPQTDLGTLYAIGGTYFAHRLSPPATFSNNDNVTVRATDTPSWLALMQSNMSLQGLVPEAAAVKTFQISLVFSDASQSVAAGLTITYTSTSTSPATPGIAKSTDTSATSSSVSVAHASSGSKQSTLVLAITLPIIALTILICILVVCLWGPRKRRKQQSSMTQIVTSPQSQTPGAGSATGDALSIPGSVQPYETLPGATSSVPHVEIPWAPDTIRRSGDRLLKKPRGSRSSVIGSSWDDLIGYRLGSKEDLPPMPTAKSRPRKDSGVPISMISQSLRNPPKRPPRPPSPGMPLMFTKLRASDSQTSAFQTADLPKRLSGVGHGLGRGWTANQSNPRSSWQTTLGTIPMVDSRPSIVMLGSFPAPPSNNSLSAIAVTYANRPQRKPDPRPTMRLVKSSSNSSESFKTIDESGHSTKTRVQANIQARTPSHKPKQAVIPVAEQKDWEASGLPPLPQRSQARLRGDSVSDHEHGYRYSQGAADLGRQMSAASSHQFDSAISSDSQWEDDDLKANSNDEEKEQWRTIGMTSMGKPPPQLIDQRKQVSIEQSDLERTQRSHKGSLRFI